MIDLLLLSAYVVILGLTATRDSMYCMLSFAVSATYMWLYGLESSVYGNAFPPWIDHLIISLSFIPTVILSSKMVSIACICYAVFQWLTAGEYIFSDQSEFLIGVFVEVTTALNLCIMAAIFHDRHNYDYNQNSLLANSWIINLCRHYLQASHTHKNGKGQC